MRAFCNLNSVGKEENWIHSGLFTYKIKEIINGLNFIKLKMYCT